MALEAEPADTRTGGTGGQMRAAGALDDEFRVGGLGGGLGDVAAVGGQDRRVVVRQNQQRGVRSGETGQIAHVDQVRYQHRVQIGGGQRRSELYSARRYRHDR